MSTCRRACRALVMGRLRRSRGTRRTASLLASLFLLLICAPPAAAVKPAREGASPSRVTMPNAEAGGYSRGALQTITNTWNTWDPVSNSWQSQVLVGNSYSYDANSNRLANTISDSSGPVRTESYGYDSLSRLTSVNYGDGQTQGYSFDPMGNRLTKSDSVAGNDTYSYNAANMLLTRNGGAYTNDINGNTLTGGNRTNSWDGQNRLTQCVYNGNTSTFTYGSDGLRRRSVENGVTTDYVLDGQGVVREMRGANVHATYFHGLRGPEYKRDSGNNVRWYLYDGLGSVLGELDATGYITASRKLDVYGAVRSSAGTSTSRHKFVGGLGHPSEDESGYIYMRARYYDPMTGRFVSEDPDKDGANWFAYARSNPVNQVDITGRNALDLIWLALTAGYGVAMFKLIMGVIPVVGRLTKLRGIQKAIEAVLRKTPEGASRMIDGVYHLQAGIAADDLKELAHNVQKIQQMGHEADRLSAIVGRSASLMVAATVAYAVLLAFEIKFGEFL